MDQRTKIEPGSRDQLVELLPGETLAKVTYGRWREKKDGRYCVPSLLSGSDYSGTLVASIEPWE